MISRTKLVISLVRPPIRFGKSVKYTRALLFPATSENLIMRHLNISAPQQLGREWSNTSLVQMPELRRFMVDCLMRVGASQDKACSIADMMVAADYRGLFNYGLHRLEFYVEEIYKKYVDIAAQPFIINDTPCTALVDGNLAVGVLVGNYCMDLAVQKANSMGIGIVVANRAHYYGMGAWYTFRAMHHGFVGIAMTNGWPLMVPPRAQSACMGSNCISMGAKSSHGHFLLDMATTVKEVGWIDFAYLVNDTLPEGCGTDECGSPTRFPSLILKSQKLCPAGGLKGYCLSVLIDLLCGVLSGSNYAHYVPSYMSQSKNSHPNLGQVFIAIDPGFFLPNFEERLDDFLSRLLASTPVDPLHKVMVPGEPEKLHMRYVDDLRGIPMPNELLQTYIQLAEMLQVKPIQSGFFSV